MQTRYGKRLLRGSVKIEGTNLIWNLVSEPQLIGGVGARGIQISVRAEGKHGRELILEYPFPRKRLLKTNHPLGEWQVPQRPKFSAKSLEADIRKALAAGWDPRSRGRALVTKIAELPT
jgi:hypothetical protein